MFPSRDEVVDHLDRGAHEPGIELRLGTTVTHIDPVIEGWLLRTSTGYILARQVVVATGYHNTPFIPDWRGADEFTHEILHSSAYCNPRPFLGKKVLVVGTGSSGLEIAYDLATGGAASVQLAVRTPPNILLRSLPGGLPADVIALPLSRLPVRFADTVIRAAQRSSVGDLAKYGLPIPEEGVFERDKRLGQSPSIVDMDVINAIKDGTIEVVAAVDSFETNKVALADSTFVDADVVIAATGFKNDLAPLVGHLGVLDNRGVPLRMGRHAAAHGLRFIGFLSRPSLISYFAKQSKPMAKQIQKELRADDRRL